MLKNTYGLSKVQILIVLVLSISMAFSFWTLAKADGTTISMCVRHTGDSYIIGTGFDKQACKNNEQLVSFNVTGPQGPQGIQGPIGPRGPEGGSVKLYDNNNDIIGYITNAQNEDQVIVLLKEWNVFASFYSVGATTYDGGSPFNSLNGSHYGQGTVYYESYNCTGQQYTDNARALTPFHLSNGDWGVADHSSGILYQVEYHSNGNSVEECIVATTTVSESLPLRDIQSTLDSYAVPFHVGL